MYCAGFSTNRVSVYGKMRCGTDRTLLCTNRATQEDVRGRGILRGDNPGAVDEEYPLHLQLICQQLIIVATGVLLTRVTSGVGPG